MPERNSEPGLRVFTILLIEDNEPLAAAILDRLNEAGYAVLAVTCAEDVDDSAAGVEADLCIIDVNLPGEDGLSLARRLRNAHPQMGIIMMTARGEIDDRLAGYQSGADQYLTKPVDPRELLLYIERLQQRLVPSATELYESGQLRMGDYRLTGPVAMETLTHRETLVLAALVRASGQRLERWQAMSLIDPEERGLSTASLEMLISAIRRKLIEVGAPPTCLRAIRGWGYKLCWPVTVVP